MKIANLGRLCDASGRRPVRAGWNGVPAGENPRGIVDCTVDRACQRTRTARFRRSAVHTPAQRSRHETRVHATLAHTRRDVSSELTFTVALPLFRSESAAIEERVLPKSRARSYS